MKIRITHIAYRFTEEEVPASCPHCHVGTVPTPEDDGFGPDFGVISGEVYTGALSEANHEDIVTPELHVVNDRFKVDEMTGAQLLYVACGNPKCGRMLVEGRVSPA